MINSKTWLVVDMHGLNKLVTETYGLPFNLQQALLWQNDSVFEITYDIDGRDEDSPGWSESYVSKEWEKFDAWAERATTFDFDDWKAVHEVTRNPGFELNCLWVDMRERGLLPDVESLWVHIWW